jgi:DNA polymerase-3 subunit delta
MKILTPDTLNRLLESGRRGGVFFLFGDEQYLKDEATAALVDAHLEPATRDFNYDQLRASEVTAESLSSMIATPPMMAEWRVIVLRDVQALSTNARMRTVLESLLERSIPGLLLILTAEIPPGRAQFYEKLKKVAQPVDCAALSDADLPGWLMDRARSKGIQLDTDAARLLAGAIGSELGVLTQELAKLIEYVGEKKRITGDDVRALVGRVPRISRWEWFDLIGDRKFREARAALPALLDAGENGVGLTIGLGAQFLRIAIGTAGGQRALEEALPPNQKWLAQRIMKQSRAWSAASLDQALEDLLRADRLLKSTPLSDTQVLEELLLRLQSATSIAAA